MLIGTKRRRDDDDDVYDYEKEELIAKKRQKTLDEDIVIDVDPADLDGFSVVDLVAAKNHPPIWYPELIALLNHVDAKCPDPERIRELGLYGEAFLHDVDQLHKLLLEGVNLNAIRLFIRLIHAKTNCLYIYAMMNCILETTAVHLASRFYFHASLKPEKLSIQEKRRLRDERHEIMRTIIVCGGKLGNVDKYGRSVKDWASLTKGQLHDESHPYLIIK